MKAGILTITDGQNYGNRLQNYAMQELLKSIGMEAETIPRRTKRDLTGIDKIEVDIKYVIKRILRYKCDHYRRIRKKRFTEFNHKYIKFGKDVLQNSIAPDGLNDKYDYFIIGSDQVWNARLEIVKEDIKNHLAFFAESGKKIAYAASFGTDDVAPEYRNLFSEALSTYKAIGVREDSGVDIVRNLCNRNDATVVLDPTMMLSVEQWKKIEKKPKYIQNQKYIVTYFLGGRGKKLSSYIKNIANEFEAEIINLDIEFLLDNDIDDKNFFTTTPDEFVWLIDHAECVLTDSFHASVFSILFHKPFCTYERIAEEKGNNMGSRIQTLLKKFGLLEFYGNIKNPVLRPRAYDDTKIDEILNQEREHSILFLKKTLY